MNDAIERPRAITVHGALVLVQLGFAGHHVVSKIVMRELPPTALALIRASSATLILLAVHLIARRRLPRVPLADLPKLAGCALLGIAANQVLFFEGLARTTAINASLLTATIPVFTFLAALLFRREQPTLRSLGGTALALGGIAYLLGVEAITVGGRTITGDLLVVANALCYALYLILVTNLVKKHGSLTAVVWLFFFGALWIAPFGARDLAAHAGELDAGRWALVAYVVLIATAFTYLVNAWALKHAPASIVAIYIYLQPLAAAVLAMAVLDETLTTRVLAAAALVFAGIYLVARPATSARRADR
jgi:drug/metabolite transporter (DMT)-like permease